MPSSQRHMILYIFHEQTERGANFHIRIIANELGIEGCVQETGIPHHPFACVFLDIDQTTYNKLDAYFQEWVGPE